MDKIESQKNLTSRSDQFPCPSTCIRISRPHSAALPGTSQNKNSTECIRSKSEEFFNSTPRHNSLFQCSPNSNENKIQGDLSLLSYFTDSSSKLLLRLLKEPAKSSLRARGSYLENTAKDFANFKATNPEIKQSVTEIQTSNSLTSDNRICISMENILRNECVYERRTTENPKVLLTDSEIAKDLEGRRNNFLDSELNKTSNDFSHAEKRPHKCCVDETMKFPHVSDFDKQFFQKSQDFRLHSEITSLLDQERLRPFKEVEEVKYEDLKTDISKAEFGGVLKIGNYDENLLNEKKSLHDRNKNGECYSNNEGTLINENKSKNVPNFDQEAASATDVLFSKSKNSEKCNLMNRSFNSVSSESLLISDQGLENCSQLVSLQDSDCTYDEIVQLLQTLEAENNETQIFNGEAFPCCGRKFKLLQKTLTSSQPKTKLKSILLNELVSVETNHNERKITSGENGLFAPEISKNTINNLSDVVAYLDEVEKDETVHDTLKKDFTSPSLEKLLNKTSVELAHEVLSLEIQIEDQKKGLKLLMDTIADMKEAKRLAEFEHQEILQKTNSDAEAVVKRHQKFIKQLLNEKKNLSETVSKLVQDLKSSEEKYKSNMKAMEEKHLIEVKKAKDTQAVADKIKREKWMEMKTQKIKEMTVKGLEPELTRMAAQQQQELTELRNLHRAEIEALELKAARRTSELMDQLRTELTKEKETAISDKINSLRANLEREFEDERSKFHQNCQGLKQRIRKLEEKLSSQEEEFHLRLIEAKQEMEKEKQKLARIHQENLDDMKRRHSVELNNLKETLESDKQICLKNHEKQLAAKFLDKEAELHEQYKRERDREIEMVIDKFEQEQTKIQAELGIAAENKLKRVKEKLETEIKELEENVADLKTKLLQAKSEVSQKEEVTVQLNSQIRQLQTEISFLRKSCEKMTLERAQLKETIRGEFESSINDLVTEKKNLQKEIFDLKETHLKELAKKDQLNLQAKNEMQKELTAVYSRIKSAISKKEKVVEALREENKEISERYRQLELMLDKQRRNLLLP